jgi:aminoglycoside phosphotransferase (APT) family kinase protein
MNTQKYQAVEFDISADLAAGLIAEQFPQWAGLPIRPVGTQGTWRVNYRLGDDLIIRLPRVPGTGGLGPILENGVLPRLARFLPVQVPELVGLGQPSVGYPSTWGVLRWIEGDVPVEGQLAAADLLASDLAEFLLALWNVDLAGWTPADRGKPLSALDEFTFRTIESVRGMIDTDAATDIWNQARQLPAWAGPGVWLHADLMAGNLMTRNGRLAAVIDFDSAGVGDPSRDLIVAWMLLPATVRPAFRRAIGADDATWLRGRARALSLAMGHLDYYRDDLNPVMYGNAAYTIREVLDDYYSSGRDSMVGNVSCP